MLTAIARTRMGETDRVAVEAARHMADGPCSGMAISLSASRVMRAVRLALMNGWTWTAVAYEAGFSDQAHRAREVRALTGYRPSRLIGAPDG